MRTIKAHEVRNTDEFRNWKDERRLESQDEGICAGSCSPLLRPAHETRSSNHRRPDIKIRDLCRSALPGSAAREIKTRFHKQNPSGMQELEETVYWLELLEETGFATLKTLGPLKGEADELMAIFVIIEENESAVEKIALYDFSLG